MPKLIVKNLQNQQEQVYNLPQDNIIMGRTSTCDIELNDKSISRKHAEIIREGDDYFLVDLKSGNGTLLNGKKVRPIEKHLLRDNDVIKIEIFEIHFLDLQDESLQKPVEEDTDIDIIEVKMIKKVLKALNKDVAPSLEVLNGVAEGKKVYFTEDLQEVDIGRDPKSVLQIDDPVISRNHAKLIRKWGGIVLLDLKSRNGCYVNNEKVEEKQLRDGDKVLLGTIKLLYRNPQDINIEAIGEEISRKKKEAAMREAEFMEVAHKKREEVDRAREEEEKLKQEEEEKERQAQVKAEEEKAEEAAKTKTQDNKLPSTPGRPATHQAIKPGLTLSEKIFIGAGGLVLIIAILAIVWVVI